MIRGIHPCTFNEVVVAEAWHEACLRGLHGGDNGTGRSRDADIPVTPPDPPDHPLP